MRTKRNFVFILPFSAFVILYEKRDFFFVLSASEDRFVYIRTSLCNQILKSLTRMHCMTWSHFFMFELQKKKPIWISLTIYLILFYRLIFLSFQQSSRYILYVSECGIYRDAYVKYHITRKTTSEFTSENRLPAYNVFNVYFCIRTK